MRDRKEVDVSHRVKRALPVLSLVVAMGATAIAAGAQEAGVRAAVEASNKKFMAAAAKGDAAAVAALYTPDAEALPPNSDVVKGRAAIQAMWKSVFDSGVGGVELTTIHAEAQGPTAYETGTYVIKAKDGSVADRGKYVVVWKRIGGSWMLHRDIWNTNLPAPKP
jgi:uncharacterized protein (TIGR02246 family)